MSLSLRGLQTGTILRPMTIIGNDGPRPIVGCQLFKHLRDKYDLDIIVGRLKVYVLKMHGNAGCRPSGRIQRVCQCCRR